MKTQTYVEGGRWVTDHIGPINAVMTISTAILIPVLDFIRPFFPYINYVAGCAVLVFFVLLAMRLFGGRRRIHGSLVVCAGLCAGAFSFGAIASSKHAEQGGVGAANLQWVANVQKLLVDIKNGKSDDPRVELNNIGMKWDPYEFAKASRMGDLRAVELFLRGGMPVTMPGTGMDVSLPYLVVKDDYPNAPEQLALFKKYGVDLNEPSLISRRHPGAPDTPPNLYAVAKDAKNEKAAGALISLGVATDSYPGWHAGAEERRKRGGVPAAWLQ
ncbi:hypothetical protein ACPWR0_00530 [Pandoraea pneumonica]|uniref:hypothetical protein n=1 Tax=Pandoraea pneumonica TaxID=2508299 RepID=UPI003CEACEA7